MHSETEERWATIGQADNGQTLVVIHTFGHTSPTDAAIRVISCITAPTAYCISSTGIGGDPGQ